MLNYIKAELYRNFNRLYFWVFTGSIAGFALFINITGKVNNLPGMSLSMLLQTSVFMLAMPVYLVAGIADMVTAEENKFQTMRNVIAFGVPRYKLVLSKFIASVILASISAFIILGLFLGSAVMLFGIDQGVSALLPKVFIRILTAIPLWIGAISIGTFLAMVINNNTLFGFAHAGIFFFTTKIISLLAFIVSDKLAVLNKYLITTRLGLLKAEEIASGELWLSAFIGLAYTVVFIALSVICFNKKEVK
jgi:ABC-2 type transport system permease protein